MRRSQRNTMGRSLIYAMFLMCCSLPDQCSDVQVNCPGILAVKSQKHISAALSRISYFHFPMGDEFSTRYMSFYASSTGTGSMATRKYKRPTCLTLTCFITKLKKGTVSRSVRPTLTLGFPGGLDDVQNHNLFSNFDMLRCTNEDSVHLALYRTFCHVACVRLAAMIYIAATVPQDSSVHVVRSALNL